MSIKLKPCPFCGGEAENGYSDRITSGHGETSDNIYIRCTICGATISSFHYSGYDTNNRSLEVLAKWNNRV